MPDLWQSRQAVGLYRFAVLGTERVHVIEGFLMHVPVAVMRVDGLLVVDGLVMVGAWSYV